MIFIILYALGSEHTGLFGLTGAKNKPPFNSCEDVHGGFHAMSKGKKVVISLAQELNVDQAQPGLEPVTCLSRIRVFPIRPLIHS